jgi:hypothetical protein
MPPPAPQRASVMTLLPRNQANDGYLGDSDGEAYAPWSYDPDAPADYFSMTSQESKDMVDRIALMFPELVIRPEPG